MRTTTIALFATAGALCAGSSTLAFDWQEQPVINLPDGSLMYQIPEGWEVLEQPGSTTRFGQSVAANEIVLAIGAPYAEAPDDEIAMGLGAVSVYEYTSSNPTDGPSFSGVILCPPDSAAADTTNAHFGWSVAVWHELIAIGAPYVDFNGMPASGVVYIYHLNDLNNPVQLVISPAGDPNEHFGWSLDFNMDGGLLVGSPGINAVFHFDRDSTTWSLAGQIAAPADTVATAEFGASVSSHGIDLVIGAPRDTDGTELMCGRVSMAYYDSGSGTYTITSTFAAPTPVAHMAFGSSVRMAADGHFVVGAPRGDSIDPGEAYVYRIGQPAPLATLVPELSSQNDYFGCSVAMTTSESEPLAIAVGSLGATDDGSYSGAVVIFERSESTGTFVETHRLNGYLAASIGAFGEAVAFRNGSDPGMNHVLGRTLIAGAPGSEVAYSYFSAGPLGDWVNDTRRPTAVRFPDSLDADGWEYDAEYSWPIATDGERLVVSERNAWANENEVRIYKRTADDWVLEHTYNTPSNGSYAFGSCVAIDHNMVLIGDPGSDGGNGDVYYGVYNDSGGWSALQTIYRDGSSVDTYGTSVAIELDGTGGGWIAVGESENMFNPNATGKVHLSGVSNWYSWPYAIWTPNNLNAYDDNPFFGARLDIDDGRVLIGAPYKAIQGPGGDACFQGAVYLYEEVIGMGWQNTQFILNPAGPEEEGCGDLYGTTGGSFGAAVALVGDIIAVGAPRASASESLPGSGLAFTYSASDGSYLNVLLPMDLQPGDSFGASVAASGNTIIVGAPGSDFSAVNGGAAWHFAADTGLPSEALMLLAPSDGAALGSNVAIDVSGSGEYVELLMVAAAHGQEMPNDRLGTVATFTSGAVANWIDNGSGSLQFDGNSDDLWSMPPEDALVLRFSRWLGDAFELWLDEPTAGASIEVFVADVAFKDSSYTSFTVDGDFTVSGPADMGITRAEVSFLSSFDIWGATNIGSAGEAGTLYVRGTSHIAAHDDFIMHGGASLMLQTSYDNGSPIINCTGGVSLGGTCTITDAPLAPFVGDRIILLEADTVPADGDDRFDMVVLPALPEGMAFQLEYGEVGTLQNTTWQAALVIVDLADLIGFGNGGNYAVAGDPVDLELTDLNGDGADEICVLFGGSPGSLYIFENDGSGGITQQYIVDVGDGPMDLTSGDIDGSNGQDLIVANFLSSNLTMLFNDGDFTDGFNEVTYTLTTSPTCVAAINIDNDGLDDLVVGLDDDDADGNGYWQLYYGASSVLGGGLAGGGGSDAPGVPIVIDPAEEEGQKDFIFHGATNSKSSNGTTTPGVTGALVLLNITVGSDVRGVTSGDFDGDGDIDIVLTDAGGDNLIMLLRNNASMTYASPLNVAIGTDPGKIISADLDGDGIKDLAALTTDGNGQRVVRVLQNNGNLAWTTIDTAGGDDPAIFGAGDVSGTGTQEIVTVSSATSFARSGVQLLERRPVAGGCQGDADGNGTVDIEDLLDLIADWGCVGDACPGDFDGNGQVDIDDLLVLFSNWGPC
jgi:hypothetical protein